MTHSGDISDAAALGVTWPHGWEVRYRAETGSTNDDLLRAAERGEIDDRTVLMTGHQTAGRGRLDRRWDAPAGMNLLASMYLRNLPATPSEVMHRVGLAVAAAVDAARLPTDGAGSVGLKWPNDVLLDGRKLAGVLAQRSTQAPGVVVGFGVNVHWAPPGAASLGGADGVSPAGLLADVLVAFDALPADITDLYRQRLVTLGQRVRVELSGRSATSGTAVDLDEAGRLIVIDDAGERHRFDVGDVVHLRPGD